MIMPEALLICWGVVLFGYFVIKAIKCFKSKDYLFSGLYLIFIMMLIKSLIKEL